MTNTTLFNLKTKKKIKIWELTNGNKTQVRFLKA